MSERPRPRRETVAKLALVLALTLTGSITSEDLDPIMDRLDAIMAEHDKVHIFIENEGDRRDAAVGHSAPDLPPYAFVRQARDRFDRIAVVANQAWMRLASRLESAMLPNIKYYVYEPDERAETFRWALGENVAA